MLYRDACGLLGRLCPVLYPRGRSPQAKGATGATVAVVVV